MDLSQAAPFLADRDLGVLMTLKRDGRPQASNIAYHYADGVVRISVTTGRAKARNLERDPRASLYVTSTDFGRYVVAEGNAELSAVTTTPGDAAGQELLALYNDISDVPHPDPQEFFDVMAADNRQVIRLKINRVYGHLPS